MYKIYKLNAPLIPEALDLVLAEGYYRMGQTIFTTSATVSDSGEYVIVLWARVLLDLYKPGKRHKELNKRNRRFTKTLHHAYIDDEIEALYSIYYNSISFNASPSATAFLMADAEENFFPSKMWQVRDGDQLIAVGYFDEGENSAAGILNFYHPDYSKYSLGKWLYLESVQYAKDTQKAFFYPGYIGLNFPKFDYKLMAGEGIMEVWDEEKRVWYPYSQSVHAFLRSEIEKPK